MKEDSNTVYHTLLMGVVDSGESGGDGRAGVVHLILY